MWTWITRYRHLHAALTRDSAEAHLTALRTQIGQVRADLAELHDDVSLLLEDLDGLTRHLARTQRRLPTGGTDAGPLQPTTFSASQRQREEA